MQADCVSSPARERAAGISRDPSAVEGPLEGYHHETYVIPLPPEAVGPGPVRGKCREPRSNLLWFDRRCFASEETLLADLQGRITRIPELITVSDDVRDVRLQKFIEGTTLGSLHASGEEVPDDIAGQILDLFRQLARVTPKSLGVERECKPEDRSPEGDTADFLDRLICFAEQRVYRENLERFPGLFSSLGLDGASFGRLRKRVAGLSERPFCLLHADLHRENFVVDDQRRLWAIDWELAMFGDPLYDLATHLYLMRYPRPQHELMVKQWCEVMEEERSGSSNGWEEDLPRLLDFKRAQSVFTDVIRATQFLDSRPEAGALVLEQEAAKVRQVLTAAAEPLGLDTVPTPEDVMSALGPWRRTGHGPGE
ncbi:aminoglycoside phosphotransferase [Streptomyces hygroscopicus]|uniref:phosphotransferase n=1 Tax=Streptomyces hygroscopicus TaxID=1912 RepID=UPI0022404B4C|nr:phosphotransferase [Streptomyces hygroscopicus]MCW7942281.1 aminoglycoside phosphotransferase [Streptomyces hygroscopicus]